MVFAFKSNCVAAVLVCEVLKLAVSIAVAREAGFVMVGENELDSSLSGFSYLWGVCEHLKTFLYGIGARGGKTASVLYFYNANTALADAVYVF